jgi:CIC family chloride channel protein
MVIGGMLGASFWRLAHGVLPQMPPDPAPVVIIGMMALFGGIAHAPLAVMLMVAEMTGNLSLLAPAMVAVAISTALVGNRTIYRSQLRTRADSPAHRVRFSFPLLSSLFVRDAMGPAPTVRADATLSEVESQLATFPAPGLIVLNERDEVVGCLTSDQIQGITPSERAATIVRTAMEQVLLLEPDQPLDVALEQLASTDSSWAPVVEERRVVGQLQVRDIMRTYKANLERSVRRAQALSAEARLFEARLDASSPLAGRTLHQAEFPPDTLVVSITRDGETVFPRATTQLQAGDLVLIMADPSSETALRQFLEGADGARWRSVNGRCTQSP